MATCHLQLVCWTRRQTRLRAKASATAGLRNCTRKASDHGLSVVGLPDPEPGLLRRTRNITDNFPMTSLKSVRQTYRAAVTHGLKRKMYRNCSSKDGAPPDFTWMKKRENLPLRKSHFAHIFRSCLECSHLSSGSHGCPRFLDLKP